MSEKTTTVADIGGVQLYDYNNSPFSPRVNIETITYDDYDPSVPMSEFINIHLASCDKIELLNNIDINNDTNGLHIDAVDGDKKISSNMRLAYVNSENETIEYALKNDIGEVDLTHIESSINSLDASVKTLNASVNSINSNFNNYYTINEIDAKKYATKTYVDDEIAKIDVGGDIPDNIVTKGDLDAYATKTYVDGSINTLNNSIDSKVEEAVSGIVISEETIQNAISNSSVIEDAVADVIGNEYATKTEVSTGLNAKVDTSDYNTKVTSIDSSITNINNSLNTKANASTTYTKDEVDASLAEKVDVVEGKVLSTNDYTAEDKNKLGGIAAGAEVNKLEGIQINNQDVLIVDKKAIIPLSQYTITASDFRFSQLSTTPSSKTYLVTAGGTYDGEGFDASACCYDNFHIQADNGEWCLYVSNLKSNSNLTAIGDISAQDGSVVLNSNGITLNGNKKISMGNITLDSSNYGHVSAHEFYKSSDERLKNFSNDISINFDALRNIPKKYFTWKSDELNKQHIGTSAQEIQKIYPELVNRDENDMLSVDYSTLSIVALKAIDILVDRIEKLENELYGR